MNRLWILLPLLTSCAQGRVTGPIDPDQEGLSLPLRVEAGATKREDVLLRMGPPSSSFEGDRILSYRLSRHGQALFVVPPLPETGEPRYSTWSNSDHNLILVFNANQVVERFSLLRMK